VSLNAGLLSRHSRYEDAVGGFSEEFVQLVVGGARTVGVLARPLGSSLPVGWVICHSFGIEQINLNRLDVVVSRAMATAGFPVLRYHSQGYGESGRRGEPVTMEDHLDGAQDAVAWMSKQRGVEQMGVLGARFGGLVAALTADRSDLPLMGVWQPVVTGTAFVRDYVQKELFARMSQGKHPASGSSRITAHLEEQGWSDLNGFVLTGSTFDALTAIDLCQAVSRFAGDALVVSITQGRRLSRDAERLATHLRSIGARCHVDTLADRESAMFGQHQYQKLPDGRGERDRFFDLYRQVAGATARWSTRVVESRAEKRGPLT
jgi:pimeloyl-ACP methyl ester carboxylesterase